MMVRVLRPCFVALLGLAVALAGYENCCERKTVGGKSYSLVKSGGTVPLECINSCVYALDEDPSQNVCFAPGNETAICRGDSCKGPDLDIGPVLPPLLFCPMRNTTFLGLGCRHLPYIPPPAFTWRSCGWRCNTNPDCQFWSWNGDMECTLYGPGHPIIGPPLACGPVPRPNHISGFKGCPIHPYTVQDKSYDATCRSCGRCPCCTGFCLWNWHCTEGWCPNGKAPVRTTELTVEHAQISEALQATEDGCSEECGDNGSIEQCYNCVAGLIKDFPLYCIKCLKSILSEILVCLEKFPDDPKEALDCILGSPVPHSCTDCICDILCHIEPSLCKLCHDESPSNKSLKCSDKTWHYYAPGKVCYKLFPETSTYPDGVLKNHASAREACVGQGGCLVTIDTDGKQNFINNLVHRYYLYPDCREDVNPRYCIWTSGNTTQQFGPWPSKATWQWDNCPSIEPLSKTGFINWPQGEPAYYSEHNAAGQYDTSIMFNQPALTGKGNWNNLDPRRQLSWMCQKATDAPTAAPPAAELPFEIPESSTEVRVLYEEDGIIVEQKDTYNNITREVKIVVPAHGNNSAIEVIMQESTMVTVDDNFCQLSAVPDYIETNSMEVNADLVANNTANTIISTDVEDVVYGLKLTDGDLSEEEEEQLSPSMKEACGGKPIVKITVQQTNEEIFNEMAAGGIVEVPETTENKKRIRRQTGCTNVKRLCTSNDKSCWRWPYSDSYIDIHNLQLNTLCVSCCNDTTTTTSSNLCQCGDINSRDTLSQCYNLSEGNCALGTYRCGLKCVDYNTQCNGLCYGNNIKCADECVSRDHGQLDRHECTTDGVTECLSSNTMCNGKCPEGTFQCGRECRPNYYQSWYQTCGEECITSESPCKGKCLDGRFLCGNRCKDESQWRECNGSCRYYFYPCNGVCQNNTQSCGNSNSASQLCLPDDQPWASDYYRQCGDECISADQACDGNCTKGYFLCGEEECRRETSREWYRDCNGSCLSYWNPCNGVCQNNTQSCGSNNSASQLCLPDDQQPWASDYYRQCGDECISADQACDIHISVEVYAQDVSITYSNDKPQECEARNLGIWYSGNTIDIPFLPVCGDMTISASSIYYNCQYNGTQRNVVIEAIPGGCRIQAIII